jgi:hypothetical protein
MAKVGSPDMGMMEWAVYDGQALSMLSEFMIPFPIGELCKALATLTVFCGEVGVSTIMVRSGAKRRYLHEISAIGGGGRPEPDRYGG